METVAQMVGINRRTLSRYEKNETTYIPLEILGKLSVVLNIPTITLLQYAIGEDNIDKSEETKKILGLISAYQYASDDQKVAMTAEVFRILHTSHADDHKSRDIEIFGFINSNTGRVYAYPQPLGGQYNGIQPRFSQAYQIEGNAYAPLFNEGEVVFLFDDIKPAPGAFTLVKHNSKLCFAKYLFYDNQEKLIILTTPTITITNNVFQKCDFVGTLANV